jgi:hypothetical protein
MWGFLKGLKKERKLILGTGKRRNRLTTVGVFEGGDLERDWNWMVLYKRDFA